MNNETQIEKQVIEKLIDAGWKDSDILLHQKISSEDRLAQIDIVLLFNLYPMALIEIKSGEINLTSAVSQVTDYLVIADISFIFVTNGNEIIKIDKQGIGTQIIAFPHPKELWNELGKKWDKNDPATYPPIDKELKPRFHQVTAISKAIENLKLNKKITLLMPQGTGRSYVVKQIVWKTLASGFYKQVLIISDYVQNAIQLFNFLGNIETLGKIKVTGGREKLDETIKANGIAIVNYHSIINNVREFNVKPDVDLVIMYGEFSRELIDNTVAHFSNSAVAIISSMIMTSNSLDEFEMTYKYTMQNAILEEDSEIPTGYKQISLGSIANITLGIFMKTKDGNSVTSSKELAITGRSLLDNGAINFDEFKEVNKDAKHRAVKLQPKDILIATIGSTRIRVGYVPDEFSKEVSFLNSLILVRVNQDLVNPKDIFDYLISPDGQLNLRRYATTLGTAIARISISQLANMPIIIPEKQEDGKEIEFTLFSQVKDALENDILPRLEKLSTQKNETEDTTQVEYIAEKLRLFAVQLSPPKLSEKILSQYPMPIAMSYRRYLNAKFNVYEQVFRLRDLSESIGFFVYNLMLADAIRRLDAKKFHVKDAGARRAYNFYSMSKRTGFLEEIIKTAKDNKCKDELFIPEIVDTDAVILLKSLEDFRNHISHTAMATESRQLKLIQKYYPVVENLLSSLEFLTTYRLVRIPGFKYSDSKLIRRMEVYSGDAPYLEEYPVLDENYYTKAEAEHLVLLNQEEQFLDLYPMYQLLSSEETRDETHICFLKQKRTEQKKLEGESVQGAFPVTIEGYETFEQLQKKIF